VDVERDWGGAKTNGLSQVLPRLLRELDQRGVRATFFVVGELTAEFRRHVDPAGPHEVGSHGLTHRLLTRLDATELRREVEESKRLLEACGYAVHGFRAPFLRRPRGLAAALARAGYRYDASGGSVVPSFGNLCTGRRGAAARGPLVVLPPSTLRDRLTPFSLTWLRIYHPLGARLIPRTRAVFYCHLHELLERSVGWPTLPAPLRALHARRCGRTAWHLVESLLSLNRPFVCCRELVGDGAYAASGAKE
jgi:hypothetical protein